MNKTIITIFAMILILSTMAFAELDIRVDGRISNSSKTYYKNMFIEYPQESRFQAKHIIVDLNFGCEDIGNWNIANPSYIVNNASFRILYNHRIDNTVLSLFSSEKPIYETLIYDLGCSLNSPTCDSGNTPVTERTFEYSLRDGEYLSIQQVTYFNNTPVTDSPCSFRITSTSQNCHGCKEQVYEQTIKTLEIRKSGFENKENLYSMVNNAVDFNFMFWNIASWIIKIGIMFFAILGCVYVLFYFVYYLKEKIK